MMTSTENMTATTGDIRLDGSVLTMAGSTVLASMPGNLSLVDDPLGTGVFLRAALQDASDHLVIPVGRPEAMRRFTCCFRTDPWWMIPTAGSKTSEIPVETQFLLVELHDGNCAIFLPILDGRFRASLEGSDDGTLVMIAETGDTQTASSEVTGLFVAVGADPYELVKTAARSVMARMQTGRLREEKPLPAFVDLFGWCTWDAFYGDVSHDKIREGLQSFAEGGVEPRFLLLDDGWQSVDEGRRFAAFPANAKFPGDLGNTIAMAKDAFKIQCFLVWHAMNAYWKGVNPEAFAQYHPIEATSILSPGILHHQPKMNNPERRRFHLIAPDAIHRFFQDFHSHLRKQGVDGVKIDNQSSIEGWAEGLGGRVELMRIYREALEGAAQTHFLGNLVNCMCNSTDMLYSALSSTVTRSSTDFWPNDPASHGLHLYANAFVSLFIGEFVHPDWDMFQSGHAMGAFHAAGRAIGGCPIYVSDKPEGHDFSILRKLVLFDGTIPRPRQIGRPTRDCLFNNPTQDDVLLKIFNLNERAGVIGTFNARYHEAQQEDAHPISGAVSPDDVEGLAGEQFAIFSHTTQRLTCAGREDALPVSLPELTYEIFTIVPIEDGIAPIGLTDKFNSAGVITAKGADPRGGYAVSLRDGGDFLAWCQSQPAAVLVDECAHEFSYDAETSELKLALAPGKAYTVRVVL